MIKRDFLRHVAQDLNVCCERRLVIVKWLGSNVQRVGFYRPKSKSVRESVDVPVLADQRSSAIVGRVRLGQSRAWLANL